jgi:hypothetical protein
MGKQLVEQRCTGGINPFLGLGNLQTMPFPLLDPREQFRIGDLVQEIVERAYSAEQAAFDFLEQAKHRVAELVEHQAATLGLHIQPLRCLCIRTLLAIMILEKKFHSGLTQTNLLPTS